MQNMQNMQNMMNMMGKIMQPQQMIFDPKKMDQRMKRTLMNQTIAQTKIGLYKSFPKFKPISFSFISNFNPGVPNNICEVSVVHEHVLDIVEQYAEKGINYTNNNNMNPVVLNIVGSDFSGSNLESNENIRDEIINIRTTFNNTLGTHSPYPLKEYECVYSKVVTIIRPKYPTQFLPYPQTYRTAMITTSPIKTDNLLSDNRMTSTDFVKTCTNIECVFQAAISRGHQILILSPFGHEDDNNPIDDIIKIYNYCIYKYGHLFKKIIIGVPKYYPKSVFQTYDTDIVKPIELTTDIDKKYEQEEMKRSLMEKSSIPIVNKKENNEVNKVQIQGNNEISKEQMEMFIKMMAMMNQSKDK